MATHVGPFDRTGLKELTQNPVAAQEYARTDHRARLLGPDARKSLRDIVIGMVIIAALFIGFLAVLSWLMAPHFAVRPRASG